MMFGRLMILGFAVVLGTDPLSAQQYGAQEAALYAQLRETRIERAAIATVMRRTRIALPQLQSSQADLRVAAQVLRRQMPRLQAISSAFGRSGTYSANEDIFHPQDDADALFRRARRAFNERNYKESAQMFRSLREEFPNSEYVPQAMYYEAFSLHRLGDGESLNRAVQVLRGRREMFPDETDQRVLALYSQLQAALAEQGNEDAVREITIMVEQLRAAQGSSGQRENREDDVRIQAIHALMQMDAEVAVPVLRDVLANRSPERAHLREQAVFVLSQKRSPEVEEIMFDVIQNDPALNVRQRAVFWLSQTRTDRAVAMLETILMDSTEPSLQEQAVFALGQHRSDQAGVILERYALSQDADPGLRNQAINWLGQRPGSSAFLMELYPQLEDRELKQTVLMSISQQRESEESAPFLLSVVGDESENMDVRKQALFWLTQMRDVELNLREIYEQFPDPDIRQQLMMAAGQRRGDDSAVDFLIEIARNDDDAEVRNQAIFWLGQTRHPRAIEALREIINR